jgi:hypothetical protein
MSKVKTQSVSYEVLTSLNYGDRRAESGETVDDLPEESIEWLLDQGHIKRVEKVNA